MVIEMGKSSVKGIFSSQPCLITRGYVYSIIQSYTLGQNMESNYSHRTVARLSKAPYMYAYLPHPSESG